MARHYYDLWCLLNAGIGDKAVAAPGLFDSVAHHRAIFFRKKKEAQDSLQPGSIAIQPRKKSAIGLAAGLRGDESCDVFRAHARFR